MAQFQEMMRQQLESSMDAELEKLVDTVTGADRDVRQHHRLRPSPLRLRPSGCDLEGRTAMLGKVKPDA